MSDYDWADQRASRGQGDFESVPDRTSGPRLDRLVVDRESELSGHILLDGLVHQSWTRHLDAPGIDTIQAAGLGPLLDPESCPFEVVTLVGDHFRAAFFAIGNVGWLYSSSSAKRTNAAGDNEFTEALVNIVLQHRPILLDAVSFPRLVRALEHGPRLGAACAQCTDVVRAGDYVLEFRKNPQFAQFLWVVLSAMSAAERDEIQRHNTAGVLTKHNAGKWILGAEVVPFGYRYDEDRQVLRPDPSLRDSVRQMWRILTSGLPASTQVDQLIDLGVLPGRPANATSALRSRARWAPLYVNGIWIQRLQNPLPGIDAWLGLPVVRRHPDDAGFFELVYRAGVPRGGWLPQGLARAAMTLVRKHQSPRRGGRPTQYGLAGFEWTCPIGARPEVREWRTTVAGDRCEIRVRRRPDA